MINFIYINPPDSGLGDRLLDIILLYSYSILLKCSDFYVHWEYNSSFDKTRLCLKLEYLLYYIKFPSNIHFFNKNVDNLINLNNRQNIIFNDTLGAASIFSFNEKYLKNDISKQNELEKIYYESFKKLYFINIPDLIKNTFINNQIITIHLRRTDKISDNVYAHGVNDNELVFLNEKTKKFIDSNIVEKKMICIISDDKYVKEMYYQKYKDINGIKTNIFIYNEDCQVKQTYYDMYCLCNSNIIFMSQKFSTFSIVSSLMIKPKTLLYPFNTGRLFDFNNIHYNFNKYPNFLYYT